MREANDALAAQLDREKEARVREMIAWALGESQARSGAPALRKAMRNDSDEDVRETAVWALGEMQDRESVDALGDLIEHDSSPRVRGTAAWAIGEIGSRGGKAPTGLMHLLRDDTDETRLKAAWALGNVGDASAINAIRDALKVEKSTQVRRALVRALIKSGGRSEEGLTELLTSSDESVRDAAVRGLAGRDSFNPWPWPWPRPRPFP